MIDWTAAAKRVVGLAVSVVLVSGVSLLIWVVTVRMEPASWYHPSYMETLVGLVLAVATTIFVLLDVIRTCRR